MQLHISSSLRAAVALILAAAPLSSMLAQVEGSALNYMLQRPQVSKQYDNKRPFDHFFIDAGAGANAVGRRDFHAQLQGQVGVGDWITPAHGVRLDFSVGRFQMGGQKSSFTNVALNYLLNITAISQRGATYTPRRFEVYGVAGVDLLQSKLNGNREFGLGAHVGLRGQFALSPFTYVYLEPRFGIVQDKAMPSRSWHGFQPFASASVGLGYRFREHRFEHHADTTSTRKRWNDGVFVSGMAGVTGVTNADGSGWKDNDGVRAMASIGKWFNPYNAVRLSVVANTFHQYGANRVKSIGVQADYMTNLHNIFGGVNPDRIFWINALTGVGYDASSESDGDRYHTVSVGAGLQANLRIVRNFNFVVEPRVDLHADRFAPSLEGKKNYDLTASLMAGLVYTYSDRTGGGIDSDPFEQTAWHDHTFIEAALGGNIPLSRVALGDARHFIRPQMYAAVGKWFTPVQGARLWAQLAQTQYSDKPERTKHFDIGLDYLINITNAFYGYREDRRFEFSGGVGLNLSRRQDRLTPFFGGDVSLRAAWNVNPFLSFFAEPRLQIYGGNYLPSSLYAKNLDVVLSASIGAQFNMHGYNRQTAYALLDNEGEGLRSSLTAFGGLAARANHMRTKGYYAPVAGIAYTQWYSPLSAWRIGVQALLSRADNSCRFGQTSLDLDWMTDLTAQTYGYDPSRPLAIRAFAGVGLGVDYGNGKALFSPDLHFGGQMAIRLCDELHLILEPRLAYELSDRFRGNNYGRWMPQGVVGLEYSLARHARNADLNERPERSRFVSLSIGTGGYTVNFNEMSRLGRRMTFLSDVSVGQWLNGVSGLQFRLGNTVAQHRTGGNECITSLHLDYMLNFVSAVTGASSASRLFQLTGLVGPSVNFSTRKGRSAQVVPGVQAALQAGFRLNDRIEVYLEPAAAVYTNRIVPGGSSHPVDGELKLSLGTKYSF